MKKGPILLLSILLLLIFFIFGVQYGKFLEKKNNDTQLLSTNKQPDVTISPSPIHYNNYTHAGCAIELLIPSSLKKTKESSVEASFDGNNEHITINCINKPLSLNSYKEATESITINNKSAPYFIKKDMVATQIKINSTKTVTLIISRNLTELVSSSLKILQ